MCFRKEKGDMSIPIKRMAGMTKRRNRIKIAAIFESGLEGGSCGGVLKDAGRAGSTHPCLRNSMEYGDYGRVVLLEWGRQLFVVDVHIE